MWRPLVQRLLMAYVADLITVLTSLFDVVEPSSSEETVWSQLNRVFQAYERLDPREQIHPRICAAFQRGQQTGDPVSIGLELRELLSEREPPVSGSERNKIGGRNAQDTGAGVSAKSPGEPVPSSGVPSSSLGGPAQRRTRPLVWYRLFPRRPLPLSIPKSPWWSYSKCYSPQTGPLPLPSPLSPAPAVLYSGHSLHAATNPSLPSYPITGSTVSYLLSTLGALPFVIMFQWP